MAVIIDSLGRRWNPLLHPRGKDGRFIRVLSKIRFFLDGMSSPLGTGTITNIKGSNSIAAKITGVNKSNPKSKNLKVGDLIQLKAGNITAIGEKASLSKASNTSRFGDVRITSNRMSKYGNDKNRFKRSVSSFAKANNFDDNETRQALDVLDGKTKAKDSPTGSYIIGLHALRDTDRDDPDSIDDFIETLDSLGVDDKETDKTPDGLSGMGPLVDGYNKEKDGRNDRIPMSGTREYEDGTVLNRDGDGDVKARLGGDGDNTDTDTDTDTDTTPEVRDYPEDDAIAEIESIFDDDESVLEDGEESGLEGGHIARRNGDKVSILDPDGSEIASTRANSNQEEYDRAGAALAKSINDRRKADLPDDNDDSDLLDDLPEVPEGDDDDMPTPDPDPDDITPEPTPEPEEVKPPTKKMKEIIDFINDGGDIENSDFDQKTITRATNQGWLEKDRKTLSQKSRDYLGDNYKTRLDKDQDVVDNEDHDGTGIRTDRTTDDGLPEADGLESRDDSGGESTPGDGRDSGEDRVRSGDELDLESPDGSRRKVYPVAKHATPESRKQAIQRDGKPTPDFYELAPEDADIYRNAMLKLKENNKFAASVHVYDEDEYKDMRLFVTSDGKLGVALKGDDIVSAFSHNDAEHKGGIRAAIAMAIDNGGRKADSFDTVLPELYATEGLVAVARVNWNDDHAPDGWDKSTFGKFNNGEPDVVLYAYDSDRIGVPYDRNQGQTFDDWGDAENRVKSYLEGNKELHWDLNSDTDFSRTPADRRKVLEAGIRSGVKEERSLSKEGVRGGTTLVTFNDGSRAVRKNIEEDPELTRDSNHNLENLIHALGGKTQAGVEHDGHYYSDLVSSGRHVGPDDDLSPDSDILRRRDTAIIAIADYLSVNTDRNSGNYYISDDGSVIAIDNDGGWFEDPEWFSSSDLTPAILSEEIGDDEIFEAVDGLDLIDPTGSRSQVARNQLDKILTFRRRNRGVAGGGTISDPLDALSPSLLRLLTDEEFDTGFNKLDRPRPYILEEKKRRDGLKTPTPEVDTPTPESERTDVDTPEVDTPEGYRGVESLSDGSVYVHPDARAEDLPFPRTEPEMLDGEKFAPTRQQQDIVDSVNAGQDVAVNAKAGTGKALRNDQRVVTPTGYREIGQLEVGDEIIGTDGLVYFVEGVYPQGVRPLYSLTFSDRTSVIADADHKWYVQSHNDKTKGTGRVLTTTEILSQGLDRKGQGHKWFIPVASATKHPEADLPIDPYVLGALLGDGTLSTGVSITTQDSGLLDRIKEFAEPLGVVFAQNPSDPITYRLGGKQTKKGHRGFWNPIVSAIRELGLYNKKSGDKFIPEIYKTASIDQRLELLQGLCDTDGYRGSSGSCEYVSVSKQLADDVMWLVTSLGGVATMSVKDMGQYQTAYRLYITMPRDLNPFWMDRKSKDWGVGTQRQPNRAITRIERVEDAEATCITVSSPDHLFLTENHIPTHNTSTLEALSRRVPDRNIIYIAFNKSVQTEAEGRMPANVESRTGHSLAFQASPKWMKDRAYGKSDKYKNPLVKPNDIANHLGIRGAVPNTNGKNMPNNRVALGVMKTVNNFSNSADDEILDIHMPDYFDNLTPASRARVLDWANAAWLDLNDENGKLKITPDHYRKRWALSRPDFSNDGYGGRKADLLFIDEAQDTPPVLAKVVNDQNIQKVVVGDKDQAIYGFTGAEDYLAEADVNTRLPLNKSYRFGPEVADIGNRFLQLSGSDERVVGGGDPNTSITTDMEAPDAILTRTNAGMLSNIIEEMDSGRRVGVPPKTKADLNSLIDTVAGLKGERRMPNKPHEDLEMYDNWDELVKDVTDNPEDNPKAGMVHRLFRDKTTWELRDYVKRIVEGNSHSLEDITGNFRKEDDGDRTYIEQVAEVPRDSLPTTFKQKDRFKEAGARWDRDSKRWYFTGSQEERDDKFEQALENIREFYGRDENSHELSTEPPDVVISTAHKSKGLEWDRVKIGDDFPQPQIEGDRTIFPEDEELRLNYVAVTRAGKELDPGSLGWVYDHTDENGDGPSRNKDITPDSDLKDRLEVTKDRLEDKEHRDGGDEGESIDRTPDDEYTAPITPEDSDDDIADREETVERIAVADTESEDSTEFNPPTDDRGRITNTTRREYFDDRYDYEISDIDEDGEDGIHIDVYDKNGEKVDELDIYGDRSNIDSEGVRKDIYELIDSRQDRREGMDPEDRSTQDLVDDFIESGDQDVLDEIIRRGDDDSSPVDSDREDTQLDDPDTGTDTIPDTDPVDGGDSGDGGDDDTPTPTPDPDPDPEPEPTPDPDTAPTTYTRRNVGNDLTDTQLDEYDDLSRADKDTYVGHRNNGDDHDTALSKTNGTYEDFDYNYPENPQDLSYEDLDRKRKELKDLIKDREDPERQKKVERYYDYLDNLADRIDEGQARERDSEVAPEPTSGPIADLSDNDRATLRSTFDRQNSNGDTSPRQREAYDKFTRGESLTPEEYRALDRMLSNEKDDRGGDTPDIDRLRNSLNEARDSGESRTTEPEPEPTESVPEPTQDRVAGPNYDERTPKGSVDLRKVVDTATDPSDNKREALNPEELESLVQLEYTLEFDQDVTDAMRATLRDGRNPTMTNLLKLMHDNEGVYRWYTRGDAVGTKMRIGDFVGKKLIDPRTKRMQAHRAGDAPPPSMVGRIIDMTDNSQPNVTIARIDMDGNPLYVKDDGTMNYDSDGNLTQVISRIHIRELSPFYGYNDEGNIITDNPEGRDDVSVPKDIKDIVGLKKDRNPDGTVRNPQDGDDNGGGSRVPDTPPSTPDGGAGGRSSFIPEDTIEDVQPETDTPSPTSMASRQTPINVIESKNTEKNTKLSINPVTFEDLQSHDYGAYKISNTNLGVSVSKTGIVSVLLNDSDHDNPAHIVNSIIFASDDFKFDKTLKSLNVDSGSVFEIFYKQDGDTPKLPVRLVWDKDKRMLHGVRDFEYVTSFPVDSLYTHEGVSNFARFLRRDDDAISKPTGVWEMSDGDTHSRFSELLEPHVFDGGTEFFDNVTALNNSGKKKNTGLPLWSNKSDRHIYTDGNLSIDVDKSLSPEERDTIIGSLQDHARHLASLPVEKNNIDIVVVDNLQTTDGTSAQGLVLNINSGRTINIDKDTLLNEEVNTRLNSSSISGLHADLVGRYGNSVYTLAHEFGHTLDIKNGTSKYHKRSTTNPLESMASGPDGATFYEDMKRRNGMTQYSHSHIAEGYAEAWAGWYLGGKGHNPVSDAYAEKYGWEDITGGIPADVAVGPAV